MPKSSPLDPVSEARRNWEKKGWTSAALGMATVSSLVRLGSLLDAKASEILKPYGISYARYELLSLLFFTRSGALPMKQTSASLNIPPASITHMVSALEKDGLVARSKDPKDGRGILVSITDQGIALVSSASGALNEFFESLPIDSSLLLNESSALRGKLGDN